MNKSVTQIGRGALIGLGVCFATFIASHAQGQATTFVGRASCGASTCHGGVIDRGPHWRSALTRWAAEDPHAGAGLVLLNSLSEQIVLSLNGRTEKPATEAEWVTMRDAVLRERCISCHATATPEDCKPGVPLSAVYLAEGVSCESCHGPAGNWLNQHYDPGFVGEGRFASGLRNNETIVARGKGCVRCHVGSRTEDGIVRDMNHDIIAAGHPVLRFELGKYDAALPKHWDVASSPEFYASAVRLRKAGRSTTLASAATLAHERIQDAVNGANVPIPEFADYDCFACHQSLSMDQYNLKTTGALVSAGMPYWNSWHAMGQKTLSGDERKLLAPTSSTAAKANELSQLLTKVADQFWAQASEQASGDFDPMDELKVTVQGLSPGDDWHQAAVKYLDMEASLRQLAIDDPKYQTIQGEFQSKISPMLIFESGKHSPANFGLSESTEYINEIKKILGQLVQ